MATINADPTSYIHPSVIVSGELTIGKWSAVLAGTVINGKVTIGDNTTVFHNVTIRGNNTIGNYVNIYDNVLIESGRGPGQGSATEREYGVLEDRSWVNHGAVLHGSKLGKGAALCLNAALDYGCRLGDGAIVGNGSACRVGTVVPDNCFFEGVPARLVKSDLTDDDRVELIGLVPSVIVNDMAEWTRRFIEKERSALSAD